MWVMKLWALIGVVVYSSALSQQLPKLSPATSVDIRVTSVQWHPHGDSLLYSRNEETGIGIGLYNLGDPEGKVVLHLGPADQWDANWFEGAPSALVTVHRKVTTPQGEKKEIAVYLLNGKQKTSYEVFSKLFDPKAEVDVDADLSPLLTHAIVTVTEGKKTYHEVLPINGGRLIASSDIDQATQQGFSGPTWSKDGTAIYGKGAGGTFVATFDRVSDKAVPDKTAGSNDNSGATLKIAVQDGNLKVLNDVDAVLVGLKLRLMPPAPPAGTPVYEVVPANGVLRQVRSPGPWVEVESAATTLQPATNQNWLDFGRSRGSAKSLWLMQGAKKDAIGTLVAAQADAGDIGPREKAVEYTIDGALFVRSLSTGR